jgi:hypothetical protein
MNSTVTVVGDSQVAACYAKSTMSDGYGRRAISLMRPANPRVSVSCMPEASPPLWRSEIIPITSPRWMKNALRTRFIGAAGRNLQSPPIAVNVDLKRRKTAAAGSATSPRIKSDGWASRSHRSGTHANSLLEERGQCSQIECFFVFESVVVLRDVSCKQFGNAFPRFIGVVSRVMKMICHLRPREGECRFVEPLADLIESTLQILKANDEIQFFIEDVHIE